MVAAGPGRCHVCPPLPGAAAGSVGSARWRAGLRDSARPGELGLVSPLDAFPKLLGFGEGSTGWQGRLNPLPLSLSRSFLRSLWRRRYGAEAGSGKGKIPRSLPYSSPPYSSDCSGSSGAPPQCPDARAVGGLWWRPLPVWLLRTHVRQ